MDKTLAVRQTRAWLFAALMGGLSACGGGGGGDSAPPAPTVTAVPATVTVQSTGEGEVATKFAFSNSAAGLSGLSFSWNFGDGNTSTEASPQHAYAKGGEFEVVLTVRNTAGDSRESRLRVSVTNRKLVKDRECSGGAAAGWCWMNPLPTGNAVQKVFFRTVTEGWRAGLYGELFKTTDGGVTWVRRATGVSVTLRDIFFDGALSGWASGDAGALLRTRDGGETWTVQRVPAEVSNSLVMINSAQGDQVLVQGDRAMGFSADAGATWQVGNRYYPYGAQAAPDTSLWSFDGDTLKRSVNAGQAAVEMLKLPASTQGYDDKQLVIVDAQRLLVMRHNTVSGFNSTSGVYESKRTAWLWVTLDGGKTWTGPVISAPEDGYTSPRRVRWVSADGKTLYSDQGGKVQRSNDGGVSWVTAHAQDTPYAANFEVVGPDTLVQHFLDVSWISPDAGQSWSPMTHPEGLRNMGLVGNVLRRLGATGLMIQLYRNTYLSEDLGRTWKVVPGLAPADPYYQASVSASFVDADRGWLIDETGVLKRTSDGGRNWTLQRTGFRAQATVQMLDANNGWVLDTDGRLYNTTDGGTAWTPSGSPNQLFQAVRFESATTGWARGYYFPNDLVYTRDGGKTWTLAPGLSGAADVTLARKEVFVAVGTSGVVQTSADEGKTWQLVFSGTAAHLRRVTWLDAQTLVAVGAEGVILRSSNAGKTWQRVSSGVNATLNDVAFADAQTGWAVGESGLVLVTRDGGKSWRAQSSGSQATFLRVQAADAKTVWITGQGATLLATGTGGD